MPMPIIVVPAFPNVPFALGVPAVLRSADFPPTPDPSIVFADGAQINQVQLAPKWGIYDVAGKQVLVADSAMSFSFMQEYRISDYPVEQGGFESYNKVATPYDARVVFTKGGSSSQRQSFLDSLEEIISLLTTWDVVTPEKTYLNADVVRYDYERNAKSGVSLLTVAVFLREVRVAPAPSQAAPTPGPPSPIANSQSPSGADAVPVGTVQAQDLTLAQRIKIGLRPW